MNNFPRRALSILLTLLVALTLSALTAPQAQAEGSAAVSEKIVPHDNYSTQTYISPEDAGQAHTIYWVKGVKPPMMSSDLSDYGTPGYFQRKAGPAETGGFGVYSTNYEYSGTPDNYTPAGYWDVNKTNHSVADQGALCYMATATNMLHWWLAQNEQNIQAYQQKLAKKEFQQDPALVSLTDQVWNNLMAQPPVVNDTLGGESGNSYWFQTIPSDPLSGSYLYPVYRVSGNGGWMDNVFGFFFNGYLLDNPSSLPKPEQYQPDKRGGFFFPIFGKTQLAERFERETFQFYNTNFKQWIMDGKAIGISFGPYGPVSKGTHAITVWGAEYRGDQLYRIFVTDSDDAQYAISETEINGARISQTLHSYDVIRRKDDMYLTGNHDKLLEMDGVVYLSLGTEIWNRVLNDNTPTPGAPTVSVSDLQMTYGKGATADPLRVTAEAAAQDNAQDVSFRYQWYQADTADGEWTELNGQTSASYTPNVQTPGIKYYHCEVTAYKYGNPSTSVLSDTITITTGEEPGIDAQTPIFDSYIVNGQNYDGQVVAFHQGDLVRVSVKAHVDDNGTLYYQWFDEGRLAGSKDPIPLTEPSISPDFILPSQKSTQDSAIEQIYFCVITNKNPLHATGKRTTTLDLSYDAKIIRVLVKTIDDSKKLTISFSTPGAKEVPSLTKLIPRSVLKVQDLPEPTRVGYSFMGWCLSETADQAIQGDLMITENLTLYPKWVRDAETRSLEYEITSITPQSGQTVEVTVKNLAAAQVDRLAVAAYDDKGRMLGIAVQDLADTPAELPHADGTLTVSVTLPVSGTRYKAFILDAAHSIPLAAAFSQ